MRRTGGQVNMTLMTAVSGNTFYYEWEVSLMEWIQAHLGTFGTYAASFFSLFGEELVCVGILGLLYWCLDKEFGKKVGLTLLFAGTATTIFKNVFLRRRPYCDNPSIKCLRPVSSEGDIYDLTVQGYSFPSGHSTNSVSLFTSMAVFGNNRAFTAAGIIIPLLCGLSRICLGVHFPTDVLCGWLLGLCSILLISFSENVVKNRLVFYGVLLLMVIPGWFYCKSDDYYTMFGLLTGFFTADFFEQRFVNFESTKSPFRCVIRLTGGVLIFFGLSSITKLPFHNDFLYSGTLLSHAVRSLRYFIVSFVDIALYPMLFAPVDRFLDGLSRKRKSSEINNND